MNYRKKVLIILMTSMLLIRFRYTILSNIDSYKEILIHEMSNITSIITNEDILHQAPVPNGVNDTQSLKDFFANGYRNVELKGTYRINLSEGQSIAAYSNIDNISISGKDAKIIDLKTNYVNNGGITSVFKFNNCKNINININYDGQALPNPHIDLGYTGATIIYCINGCENIKVKGNFENCRYGILSGNYSYETLGNCKNFDIELKTKFCGYPIAIYLADNIKGSIDASDVHRAAYLAGVQRCNLNVRFKNQYIANTVCLITDVKTGTNTSRGCSNINLKVVDTGSTIFSNSSMCAGITLSRVDPCIFSDININVFIKSNDTVCTTMGAVRVESGAKVYNPTKYPYNWEKYIVIKNLKISGVIDRSNQRIQQGIARDLRIVTVDSGHYATLENISVEDFTIVPPIVFYSNHESFFDIPKCKGLNLVNFKTKNLGILFEATDTTSYVNITNSNVGNSVFLNGTLSISNTIFKTLKLNYTVVKKS